MLYLIDPRGRVLEADATIGRARAQWIVDRRPLDDLPWKRAVQVLDYDDFLDIALRHGIAVDRGLMLDSGFVKHALAPSRMKATARNHESVAVQVDPVGRHTEDRSLRLNEHAITTAAAERNTARRLAAAEDKARDILQADVNQDLVHHWHRLGGVLPEATSADLHGT